MLILPIGVIIKAKRLNYLHYLVKEAEFSMLSQFFFAQWKYGVKNDWTEQIRIDCEDFRIFEDLDYIKSNQEND